MADRRGVGRNRHDLKGLGLKGWMKRHLTNKVVVARDGVEALDYLLGRGTGSDQDLNILPQVVLLDLRLPKINGLEVLRWLRSEKRTKLLPVVILTSSDEERDVVESYSLGANSFIRKPVDFDQFSEAVRQLGMYRLLLNQAPLVGRRG